MKKCVNCGNNVMNDVPACPECKGTVFKPEEHNYLKQILGFIFGFILMFISIALFNFVFAINGNSSIGALICMPIGLIGLFMIMYPPLSRMFRKKK